MTAEPRWLALARTDLGIRETPGIANNPVLMKRFASITKALGILYNADSVPWCGAQMAWWMTQCGISPPPIAVRASSWGSWGIPLAKQVPGAVLVFTREGGGHVTLYVGEDATHYMCLGGNQGDKISIAPLLKSRAPLIRWPKGEPVIGKSVQMAASGKVGASEA
jgi:uncharacterized protein (TIGR02594 family)